VAGAVPLDVGVLVVPDLVVDHDVEDIGVGCLGGCGGENWLPCPSRPGEAGESGSSSVVTFWRPEQGRVDVLDGHAVEEVDVFLLAELGLKTVEAFEDV